jgi:hypothetical protein
MSNHIVEEGPHRGHAAGDSDLEKQASQLASDVRYKVKKAMGSGTKMSPAQVSRAYLAQLAKSPAPGAVKSMAKKKLIGEAYGSDINNIVKEVVSNTITSVFSENFVKSEPEKEDVVEESSDDGGKKFMIVVKDKSTGNTYRRKATRAKIAELRANPNISSVEITHYGKVEDDEAKSGKKTASAKAGKDYDGDGKVESGAKEYRGAVHNAIQKKKGGKADGQDTSSVKEEFIGEVKESEDDTDRKITGKGVNNYKGKDSAVKLFPSLGEETGKVCKKCGKSPCECDDNEDPRGMKTKVDMVRNKLRSMGLKMSHVPEGEMVEELSVDDQMKISREYNRKSPEEKREANKRAMGVIKKVKREKDTRTDAQKMTDATGPRPGSRYRGD